MRLVWSWVRVPTKMKNTGKTSYKFSFCCIFFTISIFSSVKTLIAQLGNFYICLSIKYYCKIETYYEKREIQYWKKNINNKDGRTFNEEPWKTPAFFFQNLLQWLVYPLILYLLLIVHLLDAIPHTEKLSLLWKINILFVIYLLVSGRRNDYVWKGKYLDGKSKMWQAVSCSPQQFLTKFGMVNM